MDSTGWLWITLIVLLALSAFFSSSETAFSTINRIRMKTLAASGDKRAQKALDVSEDHDRMISSILVGNNVVNIAAASIATLLATRFLGENLGAAVSTVVMTVLVLIFGEVSPKSYAKCNAERLALRFAGPLGFVIKLCTPATFLLTLLTNRTNRASHKDNGPSVTEEELKYIIETTVEEGVFKEDESELLQSAIEFDDIKVQEILTPRVDLVAVDVADDAQTVLEMVLAERFSRLPVYEESLDKIIGVLHTREFLEEMAAGKTPDVRSLLTECLYVHKNKKISSLLGDFKRTKINMAVVMDDYGGTMGIVTTEDILEELVGEIWDEDEEIVDEFVDLGEGRYEIAGELTVREMLEQLDLPEDLIDTDSNTVGGWVLDELGRIPEAGDSFTCSGLNVTVQQVEEQRVQKLLLELPKPGEPDKEKQED